jgi:hypothetical protein
VLGLSEPECERSPSARSTPSAAACSQSTGPTCPATKMSELLQLSLFPETASAPSMSSPAAFPARMFPSLASALASKVRVLVSGANTGVSLARFDPDTSSWRTSQACLVSGWEQFSETFPRSGMMRSGTVSQLQPSVPLTAATVFGSWPTPTARLGDPKRGLPKPHHATKRMRSGKRNLDDAVALWPTPAARDYRYPNAKPYGGRGGGSKGEQLPNAVGGPLNPLWVEWLMGFPLGWSDCGPSATRPSRKSQRSSAVR